MSSFGHLFVSYLLNSILYVFMKLQPAYIFLRTRSMIAVRMCFNKINVAGVVFKNCGGELVRASNLLRLPLIWFTLSPTGIRTTTTMASVTGNGQDFSADGGWPLLSIISSSKTRKWITGSSCCNKYCAVSESSCSSSSELETSSSLLCRDGGKHL